MTVILSAAATATAPALRLRPWMAGDAADLAAAFQDPVLRRFLLRTAIDDTDDARRWIDGRTQEWAAGTRFSFAVLEVRAGNDPVYVATKMQNGWPDGSA